MTTDVSLFPDCVEAAADKSAVFALAEWAEGWAKAHGLDGDATFAMRLCVEEAVTNIVHHAYDAASRTGKIAVAASLAEGAAQVTVTDEGRPFDVAAARDDGREHDIESATVGGRGIRLMRRFSNGLQYTRIGDQNRLTLTISTRGFPPAR